MLRFPPFRVVVPFLSLLALAPLATAQVGPAPTPNPNPGPAPAPTATPAPGPAPGATPTPAPKDPRQTDTPGAADPKAAATPAPSPTPTGTPVPKTIEELTKDYDKTEGLFTLYRKVDNNKQKLLAEVREDQIGPLYMLQSTFASGNSALVEAGSPERDLLWRFEKTPDDRLILSTPNLWYRATDPNLKKAVERDFPEGYLDVFPIMAHSKDKKTVLIDFSGLFDGSVTGLNTALEPPAALRSLFSSYSIDSDLSFIKNIKNFPNNMVVEERYHFKRQGSEGMISLSDAQADPRSLPVDVTYNLYSLPQSDYRPRVADPRVGFFLNGQLSAGRSGYESFDDDAATDARVVYINRWNLKKKDPSAKLSAPVKPITFYLDNSIPAAYRPAVRKALLSWNKAFEPIGFKGAIEVKDAPLNDWDTADMRYNTVRWVANDPSAGGASAVALMRENPLTGEIINAGINVSSNWARIAFQEKIEIVNPQDEVKKALKSQQRYNLACELPDELRQDAAMGFEAAQVMGIPIDNKAYVNAMLTGVVAHEFGHILGLRHNFASSLFLSPQSLKNPAIVRDQGISASVMDYVGYNAYGLKTGAGLFNAGPGKYDKWAISYGYTPIEAKSPNGEKPALKKIAARSNERGLRYQSDELADDFDPTIVRYDLSSDPLAYAEKSFSVNRELLRTLGARRPLKGETYATFTRRLRGLIRTNVRDAAVAARYVGGAINRREVRGSKGEVASFEPVPLAQQRRAFEVLDKNIFAPNAFVIPSSYFTKMAPDPYDFGDAGAATAYPIRDDIARVRISVLNLLMDPTRMSRIANMTWKFPGKTIGFPELFSKVRQSVWGTPTAGMVVKAEQRDVQRAHLAILIGYATDKVAAPADAKLVAFGELQTLKKALSGPRNTSPDALTRLYLSDTLRRINLALTKKMD